MHEVEIVETLKSSEEKRNLISLERAEDLE